MIRRPPSSPLFPYPPLSRSVSPTELPLNSRSVTARPGQIAVLLGTGLGPIAAPDNQSQQSARVPYRAARSEEHTSELQSQSNLVCRLLLEKTNNDESHLRRV